MSATSPLPSSDPVSEKRPYEPSMEEILASIRRIIADDQSLPGRIHMPEPDATAPHIVPESHPVAPSPSVSVLHPAPHVVVPGAPPHAMAAPAAAPVPQYPSEPMPEPPLEAGPAHGAVTAPQFAMPEGPEARASAPEPEPHRPVAPLPAPAPEPVTAHRVEPGPAFEPEPAFESEPVFEPEPAQSPYVAASHAAPEEDEPLYETPIEPAANHHAPHPAGLDAAPLFSAATDTAVSSAFNMLAASRLADNSDELMTLAREMIRPLLRAWIDDNLPGMVERMVRAEIERVARGGR